MIHCLEIDSIVLSFGSKNVLRNVYLKCETGKITGLLGRNGSGKTCLMNIIYGELETNDKSVRLNGEAIFDGFRNPANFRYLPQFNFIPNGLSLGRIFHDFGLDLEPFFSYFPDFMKYKNASFKKLSMGEKRIIEVYVILVSPSKFCMLDEPFSQVMPLHVETLQKIMMQEKLNKGILVTDHLYQHVTKVCDNLYVLLNGQTYLTQSLEDLRTLGYSNR